MGSSLLKEHTSQVRVIYSEEARDEGIGSHHKREEEARYGYMAVGHILWMVGLPKTKTTVVIDKRLLDGFRTLAAARHGGARSLSSELEEAIRAFSPIEVIGSVAGRLGLTIARYPSLDEVARSRPTVSISAGEVVREMRDERERRISGHK